MLSSKIVGIQLANPTRIASNIVTGVGFLALESFCAKVDGVAGLTTASIVWLVAAIGMSIGYNA